MISFTGFRPAAFAFLRGLAKNNRREWFEARRETYDAELREPMRALVDEVDAVLGRVAPEFRGDAKKSVFRIYRDVRFSADKSPYKTNVACWFFHHDAGHGVGREAHGGAGFYFHVQPGNCFVGGGVWMPPKPALDRVRNALADDPRGFERVINEPRLKRRFGALDDEAVLARVPRGFDPEHPAATWLRYKSYFVGRRLPDAAAQSRRLLKTLEADIELMVPLTRWLNAAMGLRVMRSRV